MATSAIPSGPRPGLSKAHILEVAMALADESGVRALSMRQIGEHLGVRAMSLYNYVSGKDELLSLMVDHVFDQVQLTFPLANWSTSLRSTAISAHDCFLAHPWACELTLTPGSIEISPARLRYMESLLARLRSAGFSPHDASHGYHALDSHTLGYTLWELGHRIPPGTPDNFVEEFLKQLDPVKFRYLLEHAAVHFNEPEDEVDEFVFGLDLILEGLAARIPRTALS